MEAKLVAPNKTVSSVCSQGGSTSKVWLLCTALGPERAFWKVHPSEAAGALAGRGRKALGVPGATACRLGLFQSKAERHGHLLLARGQAPDVLGH